jgi:hypothetical protein
MRFKKLMQRPDAAEWVMVGLTVAIVVFGLIGTYFTWRQTDIARVNSDAALIAAKAADSSVRIAKAQLSHQIQQDALSEIAQALRDSISRAEFRIQNRAYLTIDTDERHTRVGKMGVKLDTLYITWNIVNVGKTPAYKSRSIVNYGGSEFSDEELVRFRTHLPSISNVVGAGLTDPRHATIPIPKQSEDNFKAWVAITLEYIDLFGRIHYTHGYIRIDKSYIILMNKYNDAN